MFCGGAIVLYFICCHPSKRVLGWALTLCARHLHVFPIYEWSLPTHPLQVAPMGHLGQSLGIVARIVRYVCVLSKLLDLHGKEATTVITTGSTTLLPALGENKSHCQYGTQPPASASWKGSIDAATLQGACSQEIAS